MSKMSRFSSKVFSKNVFYINVLILSNLEKNRNRKDIWQTAAKKNTKYCDRNSFGLLLLTFFYFYIKYSSSKGYRVEKT